MKISNLSYMMLNYSIRILENRTLLVYDCYLLLKFYIRITVN